eukprot:6431836-Pyramimonas_sp.AAC.1
MTEGANVGQNVGRIAQRHCRDGWGPEWRFNGSTWQSTGDLGPWATPRGGAPLEWPADWGHVPKSYTET